MYPEETTFEFTPLLPTIGVGSRGARGAGAPPVFTVTP